VAAGRPGAVAGSPVAAVTLVGLGRRSLLVATAERDQGLVGTPGPGRPLLLAHNCPRSVSDIGAVRMRIWEDLSTSDYQQITLMCNDTKAVDQRESDPAG
jgi:hypothetical protein